MSTDPFAAQREFVVPEWLFPISPVVPRLPVQSSKLDIPFFGNTGDGTHCWQAAMQMALAVCLPDRTFTPDDLDRISGKLPGKWTWPTAAMLWMIEQGLSLSLIEEFDYRAFADHGEAYILERFGEEVGWAQIEHSDIPREQAIARRFIAAAPLEHRIPTLDDIRREIGKGAVVIVNINAAALSGEQGYSGHFVVVCDVGSDAVTLHDPGLPPRPGLKVPRELFERAWAYPSERDKNLLAVISPNKASEIA